MPLDKKIRDMMQLDEMWKVYIRAEDDSGKLWKENWGWILEEYNSLKQKLDEKTQKSEFLIEEREKDERKLSSVPDSSNHVYGWVAKDREFELEKYGSDFFKPRKLPDIYKLIKECYL